LTIHAIRGALFLQLPEEKRRKIAQVFAPDIPNMPAGTLENKILEKVFTLPIGHT
jgi:hypothetical protein